MAENNTSKQFDHCIEICKDIFSKKMHDYGLAWRVLRTSSLTDQILIKASRIRSFEIKSIQKIQESSRSEFIGIINYAVMGLIQIELGMTNSIDMSTDKAVELYDKYINKSKALMERKNHDYDEAWRMMRISSYTDLILMKLFRVKQIEDNRGKTTVSEGIDANYHDIINYAVFALIKYEFGD